MLKFIYNGVVNNSGESYFTKLKAILYGVSRKLILKFGDPVITYKIWNSEMRIPFSYSLPAIVALYPNYNLNLRRIAGYLRTKYSDLKIIDVGANIGDTVILLKENYDYKILCIEGGEKFYDLLKENTVKYENVKIEKIFLGEFNETIKAALDSNLGTGSLKKSDNAQTQLTTLTELLRSNKDFLDSKLLKIDTDGFDFQIIRGAMDYIKTTKPVIFIEYDPHFISLYNEDYYSIFELLHSNGYSKAVFYDSAGDLIISLDTNDRVKITELTNYFTNRNSLKYSDICFFHNDDNDVFKYTIQNELEYFKKHRRN